MANWFRFYDDAVNDPKIIELPDDLFRAWVNVLCIAAKNDGVLPEMKHVAVVLRVKPAKAAALVTRLVTVGLVDNHNGIFAPHNWQGRQFKSDDSGPRVKKHREKLRNAKCNDGRNVTCNGEGNAPEEEEKKIEGEQSRADAAPPIVDEGLKKRAFALSTSIALQFTSRGMPVPAADRSIHWLQQGLNPSSVLTAIEKVLKRGKPISTMEYFDGAIRDEHAKPPMPISGTAEVVDLSRINWDATVKLWRGNQSIWPRGIGGEPGMPSCKCPANIIANNMIDPANGRLVSERLVFIHQGTQEMNAHCTEAQIRQRKPPAVFEFEEDGIVKTGAFVSQAFPDGWDSATGERIPPANSEVSAA